MGLQDKTLTSAHCVGAQITVCTRAIDDDRHLVYEVTATCGSTTKTQRRTIGSGGIGPTLDPVSLQKLVDEFRQVVADEAAWFENAKQAHKLIT